MHILEEHSLCQDQSRAAANWGAGVGAGQAAHLPPAPKDQHIQDWFALCPLLMQLPLLIVNESDPSFLLSCSTTREGIEQDPNSEVLHSLEVMQLDRMVYSKKPKQSNKGVCLNF